MFYIILITLFTLGILYFLGTRENFDFQPKPGVVIPPQPRKRPPQPYIPYLKFGDKRKTFFVAPK
jgi:hypothetical protein